MLPVFAHSFQKEWYQFLLVPLVEFGCESICLGRVYVSRNLSISSRFSSLFA
uniref:Uncharacterized protein n=1 Tax=Oryzias sinensis TaxID=183150 RepID=A0A8C7YFF7_9TELE